jgi:protein TonB
MMRRRDVIGGGGLPPTQGIRRMAACILSSALLHAALLAWSSLRFASQEPPPLVRVSMLGSSPSGSIGNGGANTENGPAVRLPAPQKQRIESVAPAAAKQANRRPSGQARPRRAAERSAPRDEAVRLATSAPESASQRQGDSASTSSQGESGAASGVGGGVNGARRAGEGTGRGGGGSGADLRVACDYCPAPRYPRSAVMRKAEGTVRVGFTLTSDGRARDVELRTSSGDRELDRAAMAVARRSRFRRNAGPDDSVRGYLEYQFQLARRADRS